jgi:hypothetical protein
MKTGPFWGVFREQEHSPGRESDDTEILRLTGKSLEAHGLAVVLKTAPEVLDGADERPAGVFLMCERPDIMDHLLELEARGVPHVNSPKAVLNTYRDRLIAQLAEAGVPFIESQVVATDAPGDLGSMPVWVKRGDVHNTQAGDVTFAETAADARRALDGLRQRDIRRAVIQPHVEGDLVKFYGIGVGARPDGTPWWFRWFHHKDQRLSGHPLDETALARTVRRAATALGLEVYGGDAIVTRTSTLLLDVNAWPSFALYRDEAAERIAAHLIRRFVGAAS